MVLICAASPAWNTSAFLMLLVHRGGESINRDIVLASRYDKGDAAYLNCPMNPEQYLRF